MNIQVISIFPSMFSAITDYGVIGRAITDGVLEFDVHDLRDFSQDKHRSVDDRPYGGGPGMVMMAQPLALAIEFATERVKELPTKVVYLRPQGQQLSHDLAVKGAQEQALILIAGRYEGIDQRIIDEYVDEQWSIGDYVLSGGELAAMVVVDALLRQLPEVLGNQESAEQDSFAAGLLDCPHYTRPECFNGRQVPKVLLSGDHQKIERWRLKQALKATKSLRPDVLKKKELNKEESALLNELKLESK